MANSTNNIGADISMGGQKLEEVNSFKYLEATLCKDDTCSADVRIRIASAMARLNRIWRCNTINFASKFKSTSLLSPPSSSTAVSYGLCSLTLTKRIQAFENKCTRKLLRISYLGHKTNDWVRTKINFPVGPQESLLATVKRRKLGWFGHVTRHDSLSKTILRGILEVGRRGGR